MEEIRLCYVDGETLMEQPQEPRRFCINTLLPQELCILGGSPKVGKSWLVLDWCLRVAKGESVWGMETVQGTTLYLCLEDSDDRIRLRLSLMTEEVTKNICFATASGTLADTLEEQINFFLRERPDTILIVIDTFQIIRANSGDPTYSGDYQEMQKLKQIADRLHLTILLVHHLRKQDDRDPFNRFSGTTGITGAADALFVLEKKERTQNGAQLKCTGRDIDDRVLELRFSKEHCVWELLSDSAEDATVLLPAELSALVTYMKEAAHYHGSNQGLCNQLKSCTGISVTPKGLKQKMNVWKDTLAELGVTYDSRKTNGERTVDIHYKPAGTQVAQTTQKAVP